MVRSWLTVCVGSSVRASVGVCERVFMRPCASVRVSVRECVCVGAFVGACMVG